MGRSNSRELEVALVVRGHGHDRAGPVTHQHVVGDEHGDVGVVRRVDRERAGEHAGLRLPRALGLAFQVGLAQRELAVAAHGLGRRIGEAEDALPRVDRVALPVVEELVAGPFG